MGINNIPVLKVLEPIDPSELMELHAMLEAINFPKKGNKSNRRGFPLNHQSMTLGYTRARFGRKHGNLYDLSYNTNKYLDIYNEILRIGNKYCPFEFTSIQVNKNVVCPKHKDGKNVGESMLVSFGDYEGCNIVIEDIEFNTNCRPIIFDGANLEHWNTPFESDSGNKYSLVFFNGELSNPII